MSSQQQPKPPTAAASKITTDDIVALARGKRTLRELLGVHEDAMAALVELGASLLQAEKYAEAKDVYEGLYALDPREAYERGLEAARKGLEAKTPKKP